MTPIDQHKSRNRGLYWSLPVNSKSLVPMKISETASSFPFPEALIFYYTRVLLKSVSLNTGKRLKKKILFRVKVFVLVSYVTKRLQNVPAQFKTSRSQESTRQSPEKDIAWYTNYNYHTIVTTLSHSIIVALFFFTIFHDLLEYGDIFFRILPKKSPNKKNKRFCFPRFFVSPKKTLQDFFFWNFTRKKKKSPKNTTFTPPAQQILHLVVFPGVGGFRLLIRYLTPGRGFLFQSKFAGCVFAGVERRWCLSGDAWMKCSSSCHVKRYMTWVHIVHNKLSEIWDERVWKTIRKKKHLWKKTYANKNNLGRLHSSFKHSSFWFGSLWYPNLWKQNSSHLQGRVRELYRTKFYPCLHHLFFGGVLVRLWRSLMLTAPFCSRGFGVGWTGT